MEPGHGVLSAGGWTGQRWSQIVECSLCLPMEFTLTHQARYLSQVLQQERKWARAGFRMIMLVAGSSIGHSFWPLFSFPALSPGASLLAREFRTDDGELGGTVNSL